MGKIVSLYIPATEIATLVAYNILQAEYDKNLEIDTIRISEGTLKKLADRKKWHASLEQEVREALLQQWGWHLLPKWDGQYTLIRASWTNSLGRIDAHRVAPEIVALSKGDELSLRSMKKLLKRDIVAAQKRAKQ